MSPRRTENLEPDKLAAKSVSISDVISKWSLVLVDLISPIFFMTTLSSSLFPTGTSDLGMLGISSKKLFISVNRFCNLSSLTLNKCVILLSTEIAKFSKINFS